MKGILFDSSTLISLATTCSLHILEKLKEDYSGEFLISDSVKSETIDKAEQTLRFKYEGYRLNDLMQRGILKSYNEAKYKQKVNELLSLANGAFYAFGKPVKIIHPGEVSLLATAIMNGAEAIAIDERTTRLLVEDPMQLSELLNIRLHTRINSNKGTIEKLKDELSNVKIIRSVDLALVAFKKGYLGKPSKDMLEAILWALKYAGCAISSDEVNQYAYKLL